MKVNGFYGFLEPSKQVTRNNADFIEFFYATPSGLLLDISLRRDFGDCGNHICCIISPKCIHIFNNTDGNIFCWIIPMKREGNFYIR